VTAPYSCCDKMSHSQRCVCLGTQACHFPSSHTPLRPRDLTAIIRSSETILEEYNCRSPLQVFRNAHHCQGPADVLDERTVGVLTLNLVTICVGISMVAQLSPIVVLLKIITHNFHRCQVSRTQARLRGSPKHGNDHVRAIQLGGKFSSHSSLPRHQGLIRVKIILSSTTSFF
jgi:hypothetical protein